MRTTVSILAIAALSLSLAACKKSEPAPESTVAASEAAVAAPAPAAPTLPPAGDYESTSADGKTKTVTTINADGTYSERVNGGLPVAGVIKLVDGKSCFDPSGKVEATCYTDGPVAADGSFTSTSDKGETETVRPVKK